ncbi:MAG: hypothetical protein AAGL69_06630 [Pseudomonadota bacterium]
MASSLRIAALLFASVTAWSIAAAQEIEDIEPQVNTSADLPAEEIEPGVDTSAPTTVENAQAAPATPSARRSSAVDSIELNTSQITGNQELPQVLYIVPWKSSDLGDLVGRPVNTLLDEVLAPADREVLQRQIAYYEDLNPDTDGD